MASPWAPMVTVQPLNLTGEPLDREPIPAIRELQKRYDDAFLIGPRGAKSRSAMPVFTLWTAWNMTLAFVLLQTYGTLMAPFVKPNQWWTAPFFVAPLLLLFVKLLVSLRFADDGGFCENSFLFFANHLLILTGALVALAVASEIWCEKRFSKLEIL